MTAIATMLAAAVVLTGIWALAYEHRMARWKKYGLAVALPIFWVLFIGSHIEARGKPRPYQWELFRESNEEIPVLSYHLVEDEAIYLWVLIEDEPLAYVLAWDKGEAQRLHEAAQEAMQQGTGIIMKLLPYDNSLDERREYHPAPIPAMPEKGGR